MARASNRPPSPELNPLPIQDRPADPPPRRSLRAGREEPTDREFEVIGPREVGGKSRGEQVVLCLTDAQQDALIEAGHIAPVTSPARLSVAAEKEM